MPIHQDLRDQLATALKSRDRRTASVIRMITTRITERTKARDFQGEVDDTLVLEVVAAYQKSLKKAQDEYRRAGDRGAAQAEALDFEIAWTAKLLPELLGEAEVRRAVEAAIAEVGGSDPRMAGRVVGAVMKQHKGRVDARMVQQITADCLAPT